MSHEEDKKFASEVCKRDEKALSKFYDFISDEIFYLASKYNFGRVKHDYQEYELKDPKKFKKKKGHKIRVNDDVADDSLWFFEEGVKKTCKYEGIAPLINFITFTLFSDWTRKNYIRHKTGITGYFPKLIQKLSDTHKEVFILLTQKKTKETIMIKLKIGLVEYADYYNDIEKALIKSNMLDLIRPFQFVPIKNGKRQEDEGEAYEPRSSNIDFDDEILLSSFMDYITEEIDRLLSREKRLIMLYWGKNFSAKKIFSLFNKNALFSNYKTFFSIKNEKDVRSSIGKVEYKLYTAFDKKREDLSDYTIDRKLFRKILKHYFIYIDKNEYK